MTFVATSEPFRRGWEMLGGREVLGNASAPEWESQEVSRAGFAHPAPFADEPLASVGFCFLSSIKSPSSHPGSKPCR